MHSMVFFLSCMLLLHYYWFVMISQMLFSLMFKGKIEDLQKKDVDLKQTKKNN